MRNLQLIRHKLVQMLAVGQTDILMKHQAVNDGQHAVNAIDGQQDNPAEISCLYYQLAQQKKKNKGDTHRTHITRKTFRLLAEVEETEDHDRTDHRINEVTFNKRNDFRIDDRQSSQHDQGITTRDAVDPVHEVIGIDDTGTNNQGNDNPPPRQGEQAPLAEHQPHGREMEKQSRYLPGGLDIIHKADERDQCQGKHEQGIFKAIRQKAGQRTEIEDDATTTQSDSRMGTAFVRLVYDITLVSHPKIKKFRHEEQNQNHQIIHHSFLSIR